MNEFNLMVDTYRCLSDMEVPESVREEGAVELVRHQWMVKDNPDLFGLRKSDLDALITLMTRIKIHCDQNRGTPEDRAVDYIFSTYGFVIPKADYFDFAYNVRAALAGYAIERFLSPGLPSYWVTLAPFDSLACQIKFFQTPLRREEGEHVDLGFMAVNAHKSDLAKGGQRVVDMALVNCALASADEYWEVISDIVNNYKSLRKLIITIK